MTVDTEDLVFISEKLVEDFDFYKGKRIFLTGGTGFFGKWLLESFVYLNDVHQLDITVTILSRNPERFVNTFLHLAKHEKFDFVQGDVCDFRLDSNTYDLIIHAATDVTTNLNKSDPELMRRIIMDGVKEMCAFAFSAGCKRVIYTSSGAAYGPQPDGMLEIPESFVDNPLFNFEDAYASSKLESEIYLKENLQCELVIARCFSFAGPYLPLDSCYAFGNFINDFLNNRDTIIKGDGNVFRSYLYTADLVVWLLRILSKGKDREVYNVGSSSKVSIKDLAQKISQNKIQVLGKDDGNKNIFIPSTNKAMQELGLRENFTLDEIIEKTKSFYKYQLLQKG